MSYKLAFAFLAPFTIRPALDVSVALLRGDSIDDAELLMTWRPDDMQAFSPASSASPVSIPTEMSHAETQRFLHTLNAQVTRERSLLLTFSGPKDQALPSPGKYLFTGFPWIGGSETAPPMVLRGEVQEDGTCSIKLLTSSLGKSILSHCLRLPLPPASAISL